MNRKGHLIFWEISELTTSKDHLASLGFDRFVPRNDYKSAMIKALKKVTKGDDKLYRRFNDKSDSVSFGIFAENIEGGDISIDREYVIRVNKVHGEVEMDAAVHSPLLDRLIEQYEKGRETLDSSQLRSLVMKIVRRECFGLPMRSSGGIYFIDTRFEGTLDKLRELFSAFPHHAKLHIVPVYDDQGTKDAVQDAAALDVTGSVESLIADINKRFKDGTITKRQLEGDKERMERIVERMVVHKNNLREAYLELSNKTVDVQKAINLVITNVENNLIEPDDFMSALKGI